MSGLILGIVPASGDDFQDSPFVTVDEFPGRSWAGSDGKDLDGRFGNVVKALLEAGLPDPKGLPYHEVSLPTGNCYTGDSGVLDTQGWLLPGAPETPRFVIGWNGLVYEAIRVGKRIDLKLEVEDLVKRGDEKLFDDFGW